MRQAYFLVFLVLVVAVVVGGVFVWQRSRTVLFRFPVVSAPGGSSAELADAPKEISDSPAREELLAKIIEGAEGESSLSESNSDKLLERVEEEKVRQESGIEVPETVRGIYLNSVAASRDYFIEQVIELASATELNSVVIDVKDYSGYVFYDSKLPLVEEYKAKWVRIKDIEALLAKLHQAGIYIIARIVVFQDPRLAQERPDLAVHSKAKIASSTDGIATTTASEKIYELASHTFSESDFTSADTVWLDHSGLAWVDPSSKEVWQYNISIAKEAYGFGFDEINFDYVRFPSDGDLKDMVFPVWDEITSKRQIIKEFFSQLSQELSGISISLDIFGYTTVAQGHDLGVGQVLEDSFGYFDYVCPMVYPSHFSDGFLGFLNPAEEPYEILKQTMASAIWRLNGVGDIPDPTPTPIRRDSQIRPWLQDFDLGADYTKEMVKQEIQGAKDGLLDDYHGFILWNSTSLYTQEVFNSINENGSR